MDRERFQKSEREFFYLKGQLATGRITREQYDAALAQLNVRDEAGREWKLNAESGKWLVRQGDTWTEADPYATATSVSPVPAAPSSNTRLPVLIALGGVIFLGIVCLGTTAILAGMGIVKVDLSLFGKAAPTSIALLRTSTPTPNTSTTPTVTVTASTATLTTTSTATPLATTPSVTITSTVSLPIFENTPIIPASYLAWDADFIVNCDLFVGENEIRKYGCENNEYVMLNKQATTRYAYYDVQYSDAIIEGQGHWVSGEGKREYGIIFRANEAGTLYYVFTVTEDGKYNVAVYKNEKYTDLIPYTASPLVNTGSTPNRFKVVMQGSHLDFFLNNQYIGSADDNSIASGVTGFFLYNDKPNVEVAFDQLTVSTFSPPTPSSATAVPTNQDSTPTLATDVPDNQAATPTPLALKPGVYIANLRRSPVLAKRGQPITFFPTFVNSTGKAQDYRWLVEIWQQSSNKRYGQADALQRSIPVGTHELATASNWKVAGGGPCESFRARVVYEDDQSRRISFLRTNGTEYWQTFQVCP